MKKTKLTRSLLAACSIVALSAVMYGCTHDGDDPPETMATPQEMCEADGGSWADGECTTAADMLAERQVEQRDAIDTAIKAAETAVAGIGDDSTDSEVNAANMAVTAARTAISNAEDLPEAETDANSGTVDAIANRLSAASESRMAAMEEADEQMRMDMAATGKALHAALGGPASDTTPPTYALANIAAPTLSSAGLAVNAAAGAGSLAEATDPDLVTLEAGDMVSALGSWNGMDYMHMAGTGDAMVTNEARVYTNQGSAKSVSFADAGHTIIETEGATKGMVAVETANFNLVMASAFIHSGTQSHTIPDNNLALFIPGTYDGAPGQYRCTGACTSTNDGEGSPSGLGGTWHFRPDAGRDGLPARCQLPVLRLVGEQEQRRRAHGG